MSRLALLMFACLLLNCNAQSSTESSMEASSTSTAVGAEEAASPTPTDMQNDAPAAPESTEPPAASPSNNEQTAPTTMKSTEAPTRSPPKGSTTFAPLVHHNDISMNSTASTSHPQKNASLRNCASLALVFTTMLQVFYQSY